MIYQVVDTDIIGSPRSIEVAGSRARLGTLDQFLKHQTSPRFPAHEPWIIPIARPGNPFPVIVYTVPHIWASVIEWLLNA